MPRKLLLADDSVTIQRVIELTFADEDIDVLAVGDGDAAIARLDTDPPDIVLADTGMPGRDGYEVAQHVHRTPALAHIPVVLLTGALQPVDEARAREAGCAGVLVKPFEPHMVIAKVRELLEHSGEGSRRPAAMEAAGSPAADSPADAIISAPPSAHAAAASPDDYFERLDAAFASLNAPPEGAVPSGTPAAPSAAADASAQPAPAGETRADRVPASEPRAHTLADAFAALLALEQGQSAAGGAWSHALSDVIEDMTRRVAEQVTDRVVRELAPDLVSRIAERIVREEIARLRQETESS